MDQFSELRRLGQIDSSEAGRVFREFLRGQVRQSLVNIMAEEVQELCGPKYRPASDSDCRRAGSARTMRSGPAVSGLRVNCCSSPTPTW